MMTPATLEQRMRWFHQQVVELARKGDAVSSMDIFHLSELSSELYAEEMGYNTGMKTYTEFIE